MPRFPSPCPAMETTVTVEAPQAPAETSPSTMIVALPPTSESQTGTVQLAETVGKLTEIVSRLESRLASAEGSAEAALSVAQQARGTAEEAGTLPVVEETIPIPVAPEPASVQPPKRARGMLLRAFLGK